MNEKEVSKNQFSFYFSFLVGLVGAEVPEGQPALVTDLVHGGPGHVHSHEVPHVNQDTVQLKINKKSGCSAAENNKKTGYSAAENNEKSGYSAAENNKKIRIQCN